MANINDKNRDIVSLMLFQRNYNELGCFIKRMNVNEYIETHSQEEIDSLKNDVHDDCDD
jgi:hypothetical protein